jgi:hypothetical protein
VVTAGQGVSVAAGSGVEESSNAVGVGSLLDGAPASLDLTRVRVGGCASMHACIRVCERE